MRGQTSNQLIVAGTRAARKGGPRRRAATARRRRAAMLHGEHGRRSVSQAYFFTPLEA